MTAMGWLGIGRSAAIVVAVAALPAGAAVLQPWHPPAEEGALAAVAPVAAEAFRRDSLDARVVARNPFRPSRRPAAVAFDPNPVPPPPAEVPPPKPTLALTGIVWGGEPSAVVEGFPGLDGAQLVRVGEVFAGFRIRRITAHEVTVTGMDTTWVLRVRTPW